MDTRASTASIKVPRPGAILKTPEQIADGVTSLVDAVGKHLDIIGRRRTVDIVPVLDAAFMLAADFVRRWYDIYELDVHLHFVRVSTYHGTKRSGPPEVQWIGDPPDTRDVVVLDTILDTGATMTAILHDLYSREHSRVLGATLLTRSHRIEPPLLSRGPVLTTTELDTKKFVVGYGLDYYNHYRQLPYIAELRGYEQS
jgi:hypoxanthine phosphoribosyltransferase